MRYWVVAKNGQLVHFLRDDGQIGNSSICGMKCKNWSYLGSTESPAEYRDTHFSACKSCLRGIEFDQKQKS